MTTGSEFFVPRANLRNHNLSGMNLSGFDLEFADLEGADLSHANLRSTILYGANLASANLDSADLCGANLRNANLLGAKLLNILKDGDTQWQGVLIDESDLDRVFVQELPDTGLGFASDSASLRRRRSLRRAFTSGGLNSIRKSVRIVRFRVRFRLARLRK